MYCNVKSIYDILTLRGVNMDSIAFTKSVIQQFMNKKNLETLRTVYTQLMSVNGKTTIISEEKKSKGKKGITISDKIKKDEIIIDVYNYFLKNGYRLKQLNGNEKISSDFIYEDYKKYKIEELKKGIMDKSRTYDMSSLFDEDFLAKTEEEGKIRRLVLPMEKEDNGKNQSIFYTNSSGEKIGIKMLNTILYKTPNGVVKSINKYLVTYVKSNEQYEVFSTINSLQMEKNEEYTTAVLDYLLSKKNLLLSNSEGYIGAIEQQKGEIGKEQKSTDGYSYQVAENYALRYDAEDLSAVIALSRKLNQLHEDKPRNKVETVLTQEEFIEILSNASEGEEK